MRALRADVAQIAEQRRQAEEVAEAEAQQAAAVMADYEPRLRPSRLDTADVESYRSRHGVAPSERWVRNRRLLWALLSDLVGAGADAHAIRMRAGGADPDGPEDVQHRLIVADHAALCQVARSA
ncbi:MAG: hypothetical protein C3F11_17340 [Methylocystaceae bacterium]|nr:MAG: hypothetical protein C3F11_17340 [Methylocystaceae bacterium]